MTSTPTSTTSMRSLTAGHNSKTLAVGQARAENGVRQKAKGKLTATERLDALLDPESFSELGMLRNGATDTDPRSNVITGSGRIFGKTVMVFAQDFSVRGGTIDAAHADKIERTIRMALRSKIPVIGLYDSGGARIQDGVAALDGCGRIFRAIVDASGSIPQISAIMGPCAGAAAYAPALTDFVAMVDRVGVMFVTGPEVIEEVTGQRILAEDLGGATTHGATTGVAHLVTPDEQSCLQELRYLVSLLPSSSGSLPTIATTGDDQPRECPQLLDLVPADPRLPYDMAAVVEEVLDDGTFLPIHEKWGTSILCGFGRLAGRPVAIVANQPQSRAGAIDVAAAEKAARFVRTSDLFNFPIISLVDVPGFMPGVDQEHGGILRHGAKLLFAYCSASVPRIQVILRKAYGGAYIVMDSRSLGADLSFAWPSNEVGVMGPQAAVRLLHRRREHGLSSEERGALEDEYRTEHLHPYRAAGLGLTDAVIDPVQTRNALISALDQFADAACPTGRKYGNVPT